MDDSIAEQVMEAVCNVARTGKTGDGKVWIFDLEQALRVRTGETGSGRHLTRRPVSASLGIERSPEFNVLGASRAGKPANSPVGAISRRRGFLNRTRAVFYIRAPGARRLAVIHQKNSILHAVMQQFSCISRC